MWRASSEARKTAVAETSSGAPMVIHVNGGSYLG
jgi:hypothetical protein